VFERRRQPLLPFNLFLRRQLRHAGVAASLVAGSLVIGIFGYHYTERLPWIDALLNAAMILTGEGPVDHIGTRAGKLFASGYALFSGLAFVTTVAVLFAPVIHRFLHRFHLELDEKVKE
jgi:hypothetical protein